MRYRRFVIFLSLLITIGCEDTTNSTPLINEIIYNPSSITIGALLGSATVTLNAVATDGDGDGLTYNWSSQSGSFSDSGIGNPINWYIREVGEFEIKCIVNDGKETSELSITVQVSQEIGSLSGVVTDDISGATLEGAAITVNGVSTLSQTDGRYNFENVPSSTGRSITASFDGYEDYVGSARVVAGPNTHNIRMEVARATIIGYVYNSITNQPINSAQILIEDRGTFSGQNGYYSLSYIQVGERIITAIESGYITQTDTITVVEGDNSYDIYLTKE